MSVLFAYISSNLYKSRQLKESAKKVFPIIFAFLSVFPLMLVMAFRHGVGTDFWSYVRIFRYGSIGIESGYSFLNNTLRNITDDYHSIFILSSIIICCCYFYAIYKESINPAYSVLLFVLCRDYFTAMNGIRQYISTAIVILAISYVKRKEWVKAAFIFILAFLFHRSVIIFLLLLILYLMNIRPVIGAAMVAGTLVLSNTVLKFAFPLLQRFDFYTGYFSAHSYYMNSTGNFNWAYMTIFLCFFIMLAYEYNNVKQSKELKLMYSAVLASLLVMSLSAVMPTNVQRLTWHMNSLIVLYTPIAIKSIHNRRLGKLLGIVILIAYALVYIPQIMNGDQDVLPYYSIWSA